MIEIGSLVGSFRIVELLKEGGMGSVYVGFDEKLQREVALKAIRGDRLDQRTRGRLLFEARVLSQLEHPNICRIYDFLEDDQGGFLVLELVRGRNLREAFEQGLPEAERLRIAEQIARALIAAHAKGIIHRDLKFENVMLTADGTVKVLDFGLARAHDEEPLPPSSSLVPPTSGSASWVPSTYEQTVFGSIVGTLTTMSPEQARSETATAASDMYSLGLLLQELLTGTTPYETDLPWNLLQVKAAEGDTRAVEGLSAELTELIEQLKSIAPHARPNAVYVAERLRFIRDRPARLRRRLIAALILFLAGFFGVKYTVDLDRERRSAIQARDEAEEVTQFLTEIFEVSDPGRARGQTVTAREILDRGAERLTTELENRPLVQARLLDTIGTVYQKLGLYEEAAPLLEQSLDLRRRFAGEESRVVAESLIGLGVLEQSRGQHDKAEAYLLEGLDVSQQSTAEDDPLVARTLNALAANYGIQGRYEVAEPAVRRALAMRERLFGPDSIEVASSLQILAPLLAEGGQNDEARELYQRVIDIRGRELGEDHPDLVRSLVGLGVIEQRRGDLGRSAELLQRALDIQDRVLGPDHYDLSLTLYNLALLYVRWQREAEAEASLHRALKIREAIFGSEHPRLSNIIRSLGQMRSRQQRHEEAYEHYQRNLRIYRLAFGESHAATISGLRDLATAYYQAEDYPQAEILFQQGRDRAASIVESHPDSVPDVLRLINLDLSLGEVQRLDGRPAVAEETWRRALKRSMPLAEEAEDLEILGAHATLLLCLKELDQARPLVQKLVDGGWAQADFLELARQHGLLAD